MTLKRARFGNNMTVIRACIQSDLVHLLTKTVTFVCVIGTRGQTQFLFLNIRDVLQIEGMRKVFKFLGMGAVFLTYQHIRRF